MNNPTFWQKKVLRAAMMTLIVAVWTTSTWAQLLPNGPVPVTA